MPEWRKAAPACRIENDPCQPGGVERTARYPGTPPGAARERRGPCGAGEVKLVSLAQISAVPSGRRLWQHRKGSGFPGWGAGDRRIESQGVTVPVRRRGEGGARRRNRLHVPVGKAGSLRVKSGRSWVHPRKRWR